MSDNQPTFQKLHIEKRTTKVADSFCEVCPTVDFDQSLPQYAIITSFNCIVLCQKHFDFLRQLINQLAALGRST
ncbi:hypothetical protein [Spiroplasma sp. DGKH1]|uniref:hypothetical protein n=1 Tax=Spiroplasma sp. DGKH1 TaxID=3050074 RepID=UPI0034C632EC